jgi:GGDEF domain-containing protein
MIKERIKKDAQEKNEEKDYLVSVSIGIATLNEIDHKNTDKLINLADHRMYEEKKKYYKKTGKNSR